MTRNDMCIKSALCLISCLGVWAPSAAAASDEEAVEARPFHFTVQFDPLTAALGFLQLQVEHAPAPHFSYYAGPHLRLYDSLLGGDREGYTGVGVEAGVRYFIKPRAPEGLWVGTRGVLARQRIATRKESEPAGYLSALVGYTWISDRGFVLSGGAGVQYIHYRIDGRGPQGIYPALHTAFGTAF